MTDPAPTAADSMLDPEVAALLKRDSAGLVTAAVGAPYLIWLLLHTNRKATA